MRLPRFTWLLIPLLLIGVYFLQHTPHSTRAQANAASAQASLARMAPAMADPMKALQMMFSGLWRVDGNFESTIHIKNSLVVAPVQVTPVLYMADGTEYDLAPVNVPTTGTTMVSVNQGLAQAPPSVRAHLSLYGRAALRYRGLPYSVSGKIAMLDAPRSLLFSASYKMAMMYGGMSEGTKDTRQSLEGVWWRHDPEWAAS